MATSGPGRADSESRQHLLGTIKTQNRASLDARFFEQLAVRLHGYAIQQAANWNFFLLITFVACYDYNHEEGLL